MTGTLAAPRHHPALGDLLVRGTCPQRSSEVGLAACEQAVAHLAVGTQPDPLAITDERTPDRGADSDRPTPPIAAHEPGERNHPRSPGSAARALLLPPILAPPP